MHEDGWVQWVWRSHQGLHVPCFGGCPTCSVTDYIPSGSFGQADLEWKSSTHILETLQSYWHSIALFDYRPGCPQVPSFFRQLEIDENAVGVPRARLWNLQDF